VSTWLAVAGVGAGSYLLRLVPLLALGRTTLSAPAQRRINHAGTAALTAIVVGGLRHPAGHGVGTALACAAGAAVAVRGASMPRMLLVGGAVYLALVSTGLLVG
jgi:branched-subunit amino acid transport protein